MITVQFGKLNIYDFEAVKHPTNFNYYRVYHHENGPVSFIVAPALNKLHLSIDVAPCVVRDRPTWASTRKARIGNATAYSWVQARRQAHQAEPPQQGLE